MKELEQALTALDGGDPDGAMAQLLAAWRTARTPELGDVLDGVSRAVRARGKGIEAKTAGARARQFDAILARGGAGALEFLLDGIGHEKLDEARRRVEALRAFAPDPRLSRGLLELTARLPFSALSAMTFWTLVSEVIAECGDPRAAEAIAGMRTQLFPLVGGERAEMIETKLRKVSAALKRLGPPRALDGDGAATVEALRARVHAMGGAAAGAGADEAGEELLAAIYETPEADEPRQVYADWLLERGDPRGEYIALQLQRAHTGEPPSLRERKLGGTWEKAWLGPLGRGRILDERRTQFRRGFFSAGTLNRVRGVDTIHGHREWATCEELDVGVLAYSLSTLRTFLRDPVMRGVHTLRRLPAVLLWELAEEPLRRPLIEVGLAEPLSTAQLKRLAARAGLPALRRVRVPVDRDNPVPMMRDALERLDGAAFELVGLAIDSDRVEVSRGDGGTRLEVVVGFGSVTSTLRRAVEGLLEARELPEPILIVLPHVATSEDRVAISRVAAAEGARVEMIDARQNRGG